MKEKILVVGDAMLDAYHFGKVSRISPEAPVPVFLETENKKYVPGGAANVAVNISAIGMDVSFCATVGNDSNGQLLKSILAENHVDVSLVKSTSEKNTITKLRYIGPGNQQILRVDDEDSRDISDSIADDVIDAVSRVISTFSVVVLSDYNKGFLTKKITRKVIELANNYGVPVLVDVKDKNYQKYGQATILKPNLKELQMLTGMSVDSNEEIVEAAKYLCANAPCKYTLATLGAEGMLLADKNGEISRIESVASEVFDVTGAGDTSIAYLAAEIAVGKDVKEAMLVSNYAAGIQVSRVGTSVVYPYEVIEAMRRAGAYEGYENEHFSSCDMIQTIVKRKEHGEKIVFTNGCFDILHKGHIDYLQKAKKLGDILVVGLNSDASVKRLKGEERPINCLADRADMLLALSVVDYVIPFEEDTPLELIKAIMPDVLVKGGDYTLDNIVGAKEIISNGGEVKVLSFVPGHSTTQIIKKIQNE